MHFGALLKSTHQLTKKLHSHSLSCVHSLLWPWLFQPMGIFCCSFFAAPYAPVRGSLVHGVCWDAPILDTIADPASGLWTEVSLFVAVSLDVPVPGTFASTGLWRLGAVGPLDVPVPGLCCCRWLLASSGAGCSTPRASPALSCCWGPRCSNPGYLCRLCAFLVPPNVQPGAVCRCIFPWCSNPGYRRRPSLWSLDPDVPSLGPLCCVSPQCSDPFSQPRMFQSCYLRQQRSMWRPDPDVPVPGPLYPGSLG